MFFTVRVNNIITAFCKILFNDIVNKINTSIISSFYQRPKIYPFGYIIEDVLENICTKSLNSTKTWTNLNHSFLLFVVVDNAIVEHPLVGSEFDDFEEIKSGHNIQISVFTGITEDYLK